MAMNAAPGMRVAVVLIGTSLFVLVTAVRALTRNWQEAPKNERSWLAALLLVTPVWR